jgi:hypothetical protein
VRRTSQNGIPTTDSGRPSACSPWALSIGPSVRAVMEKIFARYPRPELGYRPFLALTRDAKTFGNERLDAACARALALAGPWAPTRKSVHAILVRKLEAAPLPDPQPKPAPDELLDCPKASVPGNVRVQHKRERKGAHPPKVRSDAAGFHWPSLVRTVQRRPLHSCAAKLWGVARSRPERGRF